MRLLICTIGLALFAPATASADDRCGTYPAEVADTLYGGWGDCALKDAHEHPLWHGLRAGLRQQIRFTFNEGHGVYAKTIAIDERDVGGGVLRMLTIDRQGERGRVASRRVRVVSAQEIAELNRRAEASGTWAQAVGTWDREDGEDSLFVHCETLDMERVTDAGYGFASVNIGCNQPARLMPLVTYVAALAGLKPTAGGRLY